MRITLMIMLLGLIFSNIAQASNYHYKHKKNYRVSITNITKGISFTPTLGVTHKRSINLFKLGHAASPELASIAEGGNIAPLNELLSNSSAVHSTNSTTGLLGPGKTVEFEIHANNRFKRLSLAAMLLPTNDSFYSLNSVRLPSHGSRTYFARAYDAGSETNDELCISIPGPTCGGAPDSPEDDGEGYVYISPGIHGEGSLSVSAYDWRDAVAHITVTRVD